MHCTVTRAEHVAGAKIEKRDALVEIAHQLLVRQFMAAALGAPRINIPTPGWNAVEPAGLGRKTAPLIDVLADEMAGSNSDRLWADVVQLISLTPVGMLWLRQRAEAYATFHELDEAGVV